MIVASKRVVIELQTYLQNILKNEGRHLFKKNPFNALYLPKQCISCKKKIMRSFPCVGGDVGVEGLSHG